MMGAKRIVCLSAEAADWFWRIGSWDRVVGTTAFFTLPRGIKPKPRISGFSTAQFEQIVELRPDLIITFSDVQAPLAAELRRRGLTVLETNQRTLAEIEATLEMLGQIVDRQAEAKRWLAQFRQRLQFVTGPRFRPRVYFEEWNDPLITGINWVSELIERAGGEDVFRELSLQKEAVGRIVSSEDVCRHKPDIILTSWCGKPVRIADITSRPGWKELPAVCDGQLFEIPGEDILQPGFRLVYGLEQVKGICAAWQGIQASRRFPATTH